VRLAANDKIKSSARRVLSKATAIYISDGHELSPNDPVPSFAPASLLALINSLQRELG
jgi:hypothetical protein